MATPPPCEQTANHEKASAPIGAMGRVQEVESDELTSCEHGRAANVMSAKASTPSGLIVIRGRWEGGVWWRVSEARTLPVA